MDLRDRLIVGLMVLSVSAFIGTLVYLFQLMGY